MDWLQSVARVAAKEDLPMHWEVPSGFVGYQAIFDLKKRQIKTKIAGRIIMPADYVETAKLNATKQSTSISPNFVHSMDAAALTLTVVQMAEKGFQHFAMIHDSYGVHACDAGVLSEVLREVFVEMYQADHLEQLLITLQENLKKPEAIPELPPKGTLDLNQVVSAEYFFA